jgi:heme-degrading monooxygenase HmoA
MFAKVRTIEVQPEHVERGLAYLRNTMLPAVRELDGFRGMIGLLDEDGKAVTITLWETEEALEASEEIGAGLRAQGVAPPSLAAVERFRVSLTEILQPVAI